MDKIMGRGGACALLAVLLMFPGTARAATYAVTANSNYFNNHRFGTHVGANGAAPMTGQVASGFGPTFTVTHIAGTPGGTATGILQVYAPGTMPTGTGFPSPAPQQNELTHTHLGGAGQPAPGGGVRYQFNAPLPLGTHIYLQDVDTGEVVRMRFFACGTNAQVNPTGFDYLRVSTTGTPTATFSATEVTLTALSAANTNEPLAALIVRDANVCRIDYYGTYINTTGWQTYFSVPPTDPGIVKSMASPDPVVAGGPVSWTLTLTNTTPAAVPISPALANPTQAYGLTINDAVHTGITGLTATVTQAGGTTGGSCTVGTGNAVACSGFSPLAAGSSIVVTLSGTLGAGMSGNALANTATLASAGPADPVASNNTSTTSTPIARSLRLTKIWADAAAGHTVGLSIAGPGVSNAVAGSSTAPSSSTAATALATGGSLVTLAETFTTGDAAGYATTLACTQDADGSPVATADTGLSRTLTMSSDSAVTCTFRNVAIVGDLQIVKTASPGVVPTGGVVDYTLTVTNIGATTVTGAQVLDTLPAGLDCTTPPLAAPTCSACAGAITAAALTTSPGVTLTTLAPSAVATLTLQCRVTASGL